MRVAHHRRARNLAVAVVHAQERALCIGQVERRLEATRRDDNAESPLCAIHQAFPTSER